MAVRIERVEVEGETKFQKRLRSNLFLVGDSERALLIDAGFGNAETLEKVTAALTRLGGPTLVAIMITHAHPDHHLGAPSLASRFGAPVLAHAADADSIASYHGRSIVDRTVPEGITWEIGGEPLTVLHTPGHTHGHLALWLPRERILFGGDTVLPNTTTWVGPPDGDMDAYLRTLDRLERLRPRRIEPGHGSSLFDPIARIEALRRHRLGREAQIVAALARGPLDLATLTATVYGDLDPARQPLAAATVLGHLQRLIGRRVIRPLDRSGSEQASLYTLNEPPDR